MTIYYLMVKTHRITGLKYLCQTTQNPFTYLGSGKDWKPHLKKYGTEIETEIIQSVSSRAEIVRLGSYYSKLWNVVTAMDDFGNKIWANRVPENGGGGATGPMSEEQKQLRRVPMTEEQKKLRSGPRPHTRGPKPNLHRTEPKVVFRLIDRKEMDIGHYKKWINGTDNVKRGKKYGRQKNPRKCNTEEQKANLRGPRPHTRGPRQKVVCRLTDRKELDLQSYVKWANKYRV